MWAIPSEHHDAKQQIVMQRSAIRYVQTMWILEKIVRVMETERGALFCQFEMQHHH
jgi:hypothetical protein